MEHQTRFCILFVQKRNHIYCSWNLTGRFPSPSRSQMLFPQIKQSSLFILGDRKSLKNKFLNLFWLIFQSFIYVIKFEKHWIMFFIQKGQNSGFRGLCRHFNYSLTTEILAFGSLNIKFRAILATEIAGSSNEKLPWEN